MADTNITSAHKDAFTALRDPDITNFALFSVFCNGQPTAAICAVNQDRNTGEFLITPLFVAVTDGMDLRDHEGVSA